MKNLLSSFLVFAVIATATFTPSRSEALVGAIFKNKTVKTVGAVGSIGGATVAGASLIYGLTTSNLGGIIIAIAGTYLGAITAGVGLIILDDNQVADIEFTPINPYDENYTELGVNTIETYNSELSLLNSIRQTIISETDESDSTDDAEKLWLEYKDYLSPETFEVAKTVAREFVEAN